MPAYIGQPLNSEQRTAVRLCIPTEINSGCDGPDLRAWEGSRLGTFLGAFVRTSSTCLPGTSAAFWYRHSFAVPVRAAKRWWALAGQPDCRRPAWVGRVQR